MRIIAGEFRGRPLLAPEGRTTRPITDRAKQSVFDVLSPRLPGAVVYDCFAGTGSMGLECLSRGCERVTFFEADRSALTRLAKNVSALGVGDRSTLVRGDLFAWFGAAPAPSRKADLIFLDPPYRFVTERAEALGDLCRRLVGGHLSAEGLVIFRHDADDMLALPELAVADRRDYGGMRVEFLRMITEPPDRHAGNP
jgi:16S rRNA (guanine966-N2)-methyltransferase